MTKPIPRLRHRILPLLCLVVFALASGMPASAQKAESPGTGILALLPEASLSQHSLTLGDRTLSYQAEAATLPIRDGSGTTNAEMFYVSYTATPADRDRPVTFIFNGGPGAASAYLHIGAIGPRIVALDRDGSIPPPPARLVDNPDSWLAFTDLVFVDPVGTGYSRAADPKNDKDFWGVDADRETMAAFIRLYLSRKERQTSPVFLAGESYGGFRAALLAKALPDASGVAPSGLVLISPALDLSLVFGHQTSQILPSAVVLPSMAAVNFFAEGITDRAALEERLQPVEDYALGEYLVDLAAGPAATRERASAKVADLIGLPLDFVQRRFGQVSPSAFTKAFASEDGRVLSRYDGTLAGPDIDPASAFPHGPDAVLDRMGPIWTAAFVDYVRHDLGYRTDITYRLLEGEISRRWDYGNSGSDQGYADAMPDLQEARAYNPDLKILIAHGLSDLVTPYFASHYLVSQLPPLAGARAITLKDYLGGHMMYLRRDSRHALMEDARALYPAADSSGR
ncbi:S10 family peptidase [Aurantimonas sp. VKM B-3413]|uniref:S10 family peptidase n=1 Tax=Aurantimonas sp. VKM B-3413 TaxID=2779401 RepID=UPI001E51505A|nr:peptidase S10 [Aurantimonas sp. VKM B-3413]MCB8836928.1 peptidase S10 [Aurantimonas sp. VKM B-3413]